MCFTVNVNDKNAFYSHAQVCNSQPAVIQRLHSDREKRSRLARASSFVYLLLLLVCRYCCEIVSVKCFHGLIFGIMQRRRMRRRITLLSEAMYYVVDDVQLR